jgi:glyoxylase-like metal-dependent hydrolase (beta-lactamase superfamily II)
MRHLPAVIAVMLCALPVAAQQPIDFAKVEIKMTDLGRGLYQMDSAGGNLLVLTGPDGVLMVDDSYAQLFDKITAAVRKVSDKPIKYVINSHIHGDHHGGNEAMIKAGVTVIAHENVRSRMAKGGRDAFSNQAIPPAVPGALPVVTYRDAMTIHFNGETIDLIHAPPSHTDSDTIVYFRKANVIFMGGVYGNNLNYPFIDLGMGGSLQGVIAAEEMILPMIDDRTRIFADQGSGERKTSMQASHDMLVAVRNRVQRLIDEGKSEDEAVAAKPTLDFDKTWVRPGSFFTGEIMTRQAYRSLKSAQSAPPRR